YDVHRSLQFLPNRLRRGHHRRLPGSRSGADSAAGEARRAADPLHMKPGSSLTGHVLRHLVLIGGLVIMLAPFVWMVSTSLKPANEIFSAKLSLLPTHWAAAENYGKAFTKVPLLRYLLNGIFVTGAIFGLQLVVA